MSKQLPELIEPLRLAEKQRSLKGEIPLSKLKRLADSLQDTSGVANFDIRFSREEGGWPIIKGTVQAELELQCQRCMNSVLYPLCVDIKLAIVTPAQLAKLPDHYEPLLLNEEFIPLAAIIEDELILALPVAAVHSQSCSEQLETIAKANKRQLGKSSTKDGKSNSNNTAAEKVNPFSVLAELKSKLKK